MIKYEVVPIDESFPEYIREHREELTTAGLIKEKSFRELLEEGATATGAQILASMKRTPPVGENHRTVEWTDKTSLPPGMTFDPPEEVIRLMHESKYAKLGTVTACVSTKDRYATTLPMCLSAIITQTHKPDKLKIYDDGEQLDLREMSPFSGLLKMCDELKIEWEILKTPRKGQVANHQHCLDAADTEFIWRVDDDCIPMPDCLERSLNAIRDHGIGGEDTQIGAVGGLIHHPGSVSPLPDFLDGSLNDVKLGMNLAWFNWTGPTKEVQHLYSSFLLRVSAFRKAGGYPQSLSTVGHREETIGTHLMYRTGYKLLINPRAKMFHLREATGGIRSFTDHSLWEHDEQIFQGYLKEWGMSGGKPTKMIVVDAGIGDHYALRSILPELRKRHADKELIFATCFPRVFDGENITQISIADAKNILGDRYDDSSIYKQLWQHGLVDRPLAEGMLEVWG